MKLEKRLEIIRQSILDWEKPYCDETNKYTNKCFARYFYFVHKLNFYNESFMKKNFSQLHEAVNLVTRFGTHCGDIVIGGGYGIEENCRDVKLQVLRKCEEILLAEQSKYLNMRSKDANVFDSLYKRFLLNKKINENLKTKKQLNMNLELLFTEKAAELLKSLGFVFDGNLANNSKLNCAIKVESGNIYFKNYSNNNSDIQPLDFDNLNKPYMLSSMQLCESLLFINCINQSTFNKAIGNFKEVNYIKWNGSRQLANEMFGADWEYVNSDNSIKVGSKIYKLGDDIK